MTARRYISFKTKLASALRHMMVEEDGKLVPAISYQDARLMTEDQILSLFHFDHNIPHAFTQNNAHWNLTPRFITEHRIKTGTVDRPMIAKADRISDANKEFQRRMLAKSGQIDAEETGQKTGHRWPSRKMTSRPFPKRKATQ